MGKKWLCLFNIIGFMALAALAFQFSAWGINFPTIQA
jgi:hypothetical protein